MSGRPASRLWRAQTSLFPGTSPSPSLAGSRDRNRPTCRVRGRRVGASQARGPDPRPAGDSAHEAPATSWRHTRTAYQEAIAMSGRSECDPTVRERERERDIIVRSARSRLSHRPPLDGCRHHIFAHWRKRDSQAGSTNGLEAGWTTTTSSFPSQSPAGFYARSSARRPRRSAVRWDRRRSRLRHPTRLRVGWWSPCWSTPSSGVRTADARGLGPGAIRRCPSPATSAGCAPLAPDSTVRSDDRAGSVPAGLAVVWRSGRGTWHRHHPGVSGRSTMYGKVHRLDRDEPEDVDFASWSGRNYHELPAAVCDRACWLTVGHPCLVVAFRQLAATALRVQYAYRDPWFVDRPRPSDFRLRSGHRCSHQARPP